MTIDSKPAAETDAVSASVSPTTAAAAVVAEADSVVVFQSLCAGLRLLLAAAQRGDAHLRLSALLAAREEDVKAGLSCCVW